MSSKDSLKTTGTEATLRFFIDTTNYKTTIHPVIDGYDFGAIAYNSDLSGRLIVLTNTFSSQNASETFSYGNTFSNVPIIVGARVGNVNLQTDQYISAMASYIDGIKIDRTSASAYGGNEFHVLLFIPNN